MNYVYDILLNFNDELFDFFEWNSKDSIIHVKKIPVFKINPSHLLSIRNNFVKFTNEALEKIKGKTEIFENIHFKVIPYAFLLTDGSDAIGIKCSEDGHVIGISSLLIDEHDDVVDTSCRLKESDMKFSTMKQREKRLFATRSEEAMIKFLNSELKTTFKHNQEKICFLYYECFNKKSSDPLFCYRELIKLTSDSAFDKLKQLYDLLKMTATKKQL